MLEALVRDFETDGVCECINAGYRKLPQFVVSAANVRGALLRNERVDSRARQSAAPVRHVAGRRV